MYTRRLVQSGLSSLVVALPHEFITDNKLKRGDTVALERRGRAAIVLSLPEQRRPQEQRTKVIEVGKRALHLVERDIIRAYVKNYNEIVVKLDEPSQLRPIKKYFSYLFALEIVHEDTKKITAKDFLNYRDTDIQQVIRRIEHLVQSMMVDLEEIEKDPSVADLLLERDREVNRMGNMMMRILWAAATNPETAALLKVDPLMAIRMWALNMHLEKIGDEVKRIGKQLQSLPKEEHTRVRPMLRKVMEFYRSTFTAIHNEDFDLMDSILDNRQPLVKEFDKANAENTAMPMIEIVRNLKEILSHLVDICRNYRYVGFKYDH
jgi:phosphate uptake regulator